MQVKTVFFHRLAQFMEYSNTDWEYTMCFNLLLSHIITYGNYLSIFLDAQNRTLKKTYINFFYIDLLGITFHQVIPNL
jgi:hypothetical protein